MRKPAFACAKTNTQISCYCTAARRLCVRYTDSTIPLLPKSEVSRFVAAQAGLCQTWLETPQTGFLASQLKCADVGINFGFTSVVQPFLLSVNGERMCTKHL